jgi:predicted Zn-dependent protease
MQVMHSIARRLTLSVLAMTFLPLPTHGRRRDTLLPDGVCGNRETMLEAAQAGKAMLRQALAAGMPWGDKSLNEYINRLGQNLARSSGSQQIFSFYVLYNPEVNARSFPGGYIVINTGVISLTESEAELASVLSHEIAHENSCDWRTAPGRGNFLELISVVPILVLGGPAGIAIAAGSGWAGTLVRARFSRSQEERADRLAAQYLVRAGYDPHAAVQFFQRLQAEQERSGGEPGGLLATHPRSTDRRKRLEKVILNLPPPEFALQDEAEFLRMRRAVRDYDEMYSRLVGVRVPGHDPPPPRLPHRRPSPASR